MFSHFRYILRHFSFSFSLVTDVLLIRFHFVVVVVLRCMLFTVGSLTIDPLNCLNFELQ